MRWLDATPRRATPKGHETFISRAASTSSHRLLQRRLLSAHTAQNATQPKLIIKSRSAVPALSLGAGSSRSVGPALSLEQQLRDDREDVD
jgi:hypothetical protein